MSSVERQTYFDVHDLHVKGVDEFVSSVARALPPETTLLDAGAGHCHYKPFYEHTRFVTCDLGVGEADEKYDRVDVICDLDWLPMRSAYFDAVLCTQVLEHVPHPHIVFAEMARVLRPGGRLYLSVPFLGDHEHQIPYDFFRYTHFGLERLSKEAGLVVERLEPLGGYFCVIAHHLKRWFDFPFILFPAVQNAKDGPLAALKPLFSLIRIPCQFLLGLMNRTAEWLDRSPLKRQHYAVAWRLVARKPA